MAAADSDYINLNKALWDERAPEHAKSANYACQRLIDDPRSLSDVVAHDLPLLGDVRDLEIAHLQCHIGTDTLSLVRLGAKRAVGLDFSPASVREANNLAKQAAGGEKLSFVEASVYDALKVMQPASFEMVYTGIGSLCWIPSIKQWAEVVSGLLKPGGRLFIREGHPVVWSLDGDVTSAPTIGASYFETTEPTIVTLNKSYVATDKQTFEAKTSVQWNHGMGEIVTALLEAGMAITGLVEHKSVPWRNLPGQMERTGPFGEWQMITGKDNLPLSYTLQARKMC